MTQFRARTCQAWGCHAPKVEGEPYCARHVNGGTDSTPEPPLPPLPPARPARGVSVLICPHCGERGHVTTKVVKLKRGVSGGKATGALLTGGLSLFAVGLSRKEQHLERHCYNCDSDWLV